MRQAKTYKVDLKAYMAECEASYVRFQKLLPRNESFRRYSLDNNKGDHWLIEFTVTQRCKYTTMVTVEQLSKSHWLAELHFECRLYHDVRMVEVIRFQRQRASLANYRYPNVKMLQKDEKYQQHRFLSECLRYCLHQGLYEFEVELE